MSATLAIKGATLSDAIEAIKTHYGDIPVKTVLRDNLYLFFIDAPDKYYQNYIAQLGKNAFVMDLPAAEKCEGVRMATVKEPDYTLVTPEFFKKITSIDGK